MVLLFILITEKNDSHLVRCTAYLFRLLQSMCFLQCSLEDLLPKNMRRKLPRCVLLQRKQKHSEVVRMIADLFISEMWATLESTIYDRRLYICAKRKKKRKYLYFSRHKIKM